MIRITVDDAAALIEALQFRAARLESMARVPKANRSALGLRVRAGHMRELRHRIVLMKAENKAMTMEVDSAQAG